MNTEITKNNALRLALALVTGVALALSALPLGDVSAGATNNKNNEGPNDTVTYCEASGGVGDFDNEYEPDDGQGQALANKAESGGQPTNHVIPSFGYDQGGDTEEFDGHNLGEIGDLDITGQDLLDANCDLGAALDDGGDNGAETFTLHATKLVCDSTDDLPNWSDTDEVIEDNTAAQYAHDNRDCRVEEDWQFQWAAGPVTTSVADDNAGALEKDGWMEPFTVSTEITIDDFSQIAVREVTQDGYVEFTGEEATGEPENPSAELWCHEDVKNYDNLEYIDVEDGGEYHCVAFNVEKTQTFTFEGHKYEVFADSDAEKPVEDWEMRLYEAGSGEKGGDNAVATTSTDADGYFKFERELEPEESPNDYFVMEEFREDWEFDRVEVDGEVQDDIMYGCRVPEFGHDSHEVMGVPQDPTSVQCDFYNQQVEEETFTFYGYKYEDESGEGERHEAMEALSGWEFQLIYTGGEDDQVFDSTTTDASGRYEFEITESSVPEGAEPADFYVVEVEQSNWTQTAIYGEFMGDTALIPECALPRGGRSHDGGDVGVMVAEYPGELSEELRCDFLNTRDEVEEASEPQQPAQRQSGNAANAVSATGAVAGAATSSEPEGEVLGEATRQCSPILNTYMRQGQAADRQQVLFLQAFLTGQGINTPMTGEFDSATDASVRAYQERHRAEILTPWFEAGLMSHENPTGYVYKLTRHKINDSICPGSEPMPELN